jgi:hypothetical protein
MRLKKVVSGGQTGVDRAALDAAIALKIPHGGYCPKGRLAEDGRIPRRYQLIETQSPQYVVRTRQNVAESDGTLLLPRGPLSGGTQRTAEHAWQIGKPVLLIDLAADVADASKLYREWTAHHAVEVLNIAGPRESRQPGVYETAKKLLLQILRIA